MIVSWADGDTFWTQRSPFTSEDGAWLALLTLHFLMAFTAFFSDGMPAFKLSTVHGSSSGMHYSSSFMNVDKPKVQHAYIRILSAIPEVIPSADRYIILSTGAEVVE